MRLPLLHIQSKTALMLADFHANVGNVEDAGEWFRTALVLATIDNYNNGTWNEETLRRNLHSAFLGTDDEITALTRDLIRE